MATIASAPTSKEPQLGRISQRLSATTDERPSCLMMKLLTPAPLDAPYPGPSAPLLAYSVPYDDESRMNRRGTSGIFLSSPPYGAQIHARNLHSEVGASTNSGRGHLR